MIALRVSPSVSHSLSSGSECANFGYGQTLTLGKAQDTSPATPGRVILYQLNSRRNSSRCLRFWSVKLLTLTFVFA